MGELTCFDGSRETLSVGVPCRKIGGDYQLSGQVRAIFSKSSGVIRVVVEHEPGFLHIYNPTQLLRIFPGGER